MFTSINPATGEPGESFAELDGDGVEAALVRADAAFASWWVSPVAQRVALLNAIADRFEAAKHHLAETATREMGKTLASAVAEVEKCVAGFRYYAEHGPAFLKGEEVALPNGRVVTVPGSRHEVLQETDDRRALFWSEFDALVAPISPSA